MTNELLFYFLREYNHTQTMAGKIWCIKLLAGQLCLNDEISLFGIDVVGDERFSGKVNAVIKNICKNGKFADKSDIIANQGDIITIDLKHCYADGKKIDKRDIKMTKSSIGVSLNEDCENMHTMNVRFKDEADFIEKLMLTLEKQKEKSLELKREFINGYQVSIVWFGKSISAYCTSINFLHENYLSNNDIVASFKLRNYTLPIPKSSNIRNMIEYIVIKEPININVDKTLSTRWVYHSGELVFEN